MLRRFVQSARDEPFMWMIRWGIGLAICLAGLAVMPLNGFDQSSLDGASYLLGAGLSVIVFNALIRYSFSGERDRDDESAARAFYARHGHWPDEPAPPPAPRSRPHG